MSLTQIGVFGIISTSETILDLRRQEGNLHMFMNPTGISINPATCASVMRWTASRIWHVSAT
jgi:hypothetical protein